jgi:hypothetical protein
VLSLSAQLTQTARRGRKYQAAVQEWIWCMASYSQYACSALLHLALAASKKEHDENQKRMLFVANR